MAPSDRITASGVGARTEPVYWIEAYSRAGGQSSELPTDMWVKRPRGQLHKVAKAASLRAAFPEEGEYTAEEMEGKEIEAGGVVIEHDASKKRVRDGSDGNPKSSRQAKMAGDWEITKEIAAITSDAELDAWQEKHAATIATFNATWREQYDELIDAKRAELAKSSADSGLSEADSAALLKQLTLTVGRCESQTALKEWVRDKQTKASIRSLIEADYETFEAAYDTRLNTLPAEE